MRWLLSCFLAFALVCVFINRNGVLLTDKFSHLSPKEGDENENIREKWFEGMHRAAPGVDWHAIESQNQINAFNLRRRYLSLRTTDSKDESFGNGKVQGYWDEKGSNNQAGRNSDADYDPINNNFYAISNNGTFWRKKVNGSAWTELNKDSRFWHGVLKVVKKADGSNRLILSNRYQIIYSDDEGASFMPATGIANPRTICVVPGITTYIYCLNFDGLYLSTNLGQSFSKIFNVYNDLESVCIAKTHNSNNVYLLDNRTQTGAMRLYSINGSSITLISTTTISQYNTRTQLRGVTIGNTTTLYALLADTKVYRSVDNGVTWTLQSTIPGAVAFEVAMDDPQKVFVGGLEENRSLDGGNTWKLVNGWGAYYSNPAIFLHGDIQTITTFKRPDGSIIYFINCDGGTYVSTDDCATVSNIGLTTLRNSEYYDVLTDPDEPDRVYAGSQDQGLQRNLSSTKPGILNFDQWRSGDYGSLTLSGNPKHLWTEYPGGLVDFYIEPLGAISAGYSLTGTFKPNYGWLMPITNVADKSSNDVLMAGGNINGGDGSYLIRLSPKTTAPYSITASQYNYDFKANSNSGRDGITAIESSYIDNGRIYVATQDGTFFYTNNNGTSWSKTQFFSGPGAGFLFSTSIYSSRLTSNLLWFAGSGYSNPPVYRSTDGGKSFSPISNGLPSTLVYQIVANPTETMLFAATEAGPYVYIISENKWYPMIGATNPIHTYDCIEYIEATNTVRFGTYGRGIWDFVITNAPPPRPSITGVFTLCPGSSTTLKSTWHGTNQWYKNGVATTGSTDSTLVVTEPGNYTVVAIDNSQRSNSSTQAIVVLASEPPAPSIVASGPTTVCAGNKVLLTASGQGLSAGNSIKLNGTNNYISIPGDQFQKPSSQITIETWLKAGNIHSNRYSEIYRKEDGNSRHLLSFQEYGTILSFGLEINGSYDELDVPITTSDYEGQWVHVAATYDGVAKKLYKNGELIGARLANGPIGTSGSAPAIIGSLSGTSEFLDGTLDEFRIWNIAWAQSQIQTAMNQNVGVNSTGLLLYLKFDEGSGSVVVNSVNNNSCSLANNPAWAISQVPWSSGSFLWFKNGSSINSPSPYSYQASQSGDYTLKAISKNGCTSSPTAAVNVVINPLPPKPTITQVNNILKSSSLTGNQWFLNAQPISGATDSIYVPTVSGLYSVQTTINGCTSPLSESLNQTVTAITGVTTSSGIRIFPVPVRQQLYIRGVAGRTYKFQLIDMKGALITEQRFTTQYDQDMSKLSSGNYVVKITDVKQNKTYQQKIIRL